MSKRVSVKSNSFKISKNQQISHKVSKIYESRNIMQIIMEINRQQEFKTQNLRQLRVDISNLENENEMIFREENDQESDLNINSYKAIILKQINRTSKEIESIDKVKIQEEEDEEDMLPSLLEKFFRKLISKAQTLKRQFKISKGLNVYEDFVLVNVHVCQYCGQKFSKPCSLGGHISKLHH